MIQVNLIQRFPLSKQIVSQRPAKAADIHDIHIENITGLEFTNFCWIWLLCRYKFHSLKPANKNNQDWSCVRKSSMESRMLSRYSFIWRRRSYYCMRVPYKLSVIWQVCYYQSSLIIIQTSEINLSSFKISFLRGGPSSSPPPCRAWKWWWGWWCWWSLKLPTPPSSWLLLHVLVVVTTTKVGHSPEKYQWQYQCLIWWLWIWLW